MSLDIHMMGIDDETYQQLLAIARATGKSVADVAADALAKHLADSKQLKESSDRKLLCEG